MCAKFGRDPSRKIFNNINPRPGWGGSNFFFEVRLYIRTCVQKMWARCGPTARADGQVYNMTKVRTHEDTDTGTKVCTHAQWIGNPLNPPGVGWVNFFRWELIWPISSHPIKMWARSDGRFEKSVLQVYNGWLKVVLLYTCIKNYSSLVENDELTAFVWRSNLLLPVRRLHCFDVSSRRRLLRNRRRVALCTRCWRCRNPCRPRCNHWVYGRVPSPQEHRSR